MSQKVLELAIVCADITQAEVELKLMQDTGAQSLPGTPSVAFLEAVLSIAKAKHSQQVRELSPAELLELKALI
jgi:mRNA-degrading endonuclease toxin of MazEF toxin-antitoxin module